MVEGLTELVNLTELHIAHQRLSEGETLHFDPCSLKAVAVSLLTYNVLVCYNVLHISALILYILQASLLRWRVSLISWC